MKNLLVSLALLSVLSACKGSAERTSAGQEAPDSKNGVWLFDLKTMPTYAEIAATKQVVTKKVPWTDTYWPFTETGMARRWGKVGNKTSETGFASFWQNQIDATKSQTLDPNLSPAEKYDILYRMRWQKPTDEEALKAEIKSLEDSEQTLARAADLTEKRKIMGDLFTMLGKSKALQSWSPMAVEGWTRWLSFNRHKDYQFLDEKDTGKDWGWMGYCNGWAAAALMHDAPKHSVLVKIDDKEVLFGEGDIRGLLTKAWASHHPRESQYFLGRRCNENVEDALGEIPMDGDARGATGTFTDAEGNVKNFTMMDEYLPGAAVEGRRIYQIMVDKNTAPNYLVEKFGADNKATYFMSSDTQRLRSFVESGNTEGLSTVPSVKFYGCWDVNPASFHTILTQHLGKKNLGFVMDRTRTGQVWNQPVYGARFTVGPLLDAAAVDDALFRYRAPGTTYLSEVTTQVFWSTEPSEPSLDYAPEFDRKHITSTEYTYTLEFDADQNLIGGEWGDLKADNTKLVIPDFLYAYTEGSEPKDLLKSGFDYSGILKPIHACSLASTGIKSMRVNGKNVEYTDCVITRGN